MLYLSFKFVSTVNIEEDINKIAQVNDNVWFFGLSIFSDFEYKITIFSEFNFYIFSDNFNLLNVISF